MMQSYSLKLLLVFLALLKRKPHDLSGCTVEDLFIQWWFGCRFFHERILWIEAFYGIIEKLWLERYNRVFRNNCKSVKEVVDSVVCSVSEWVVKRREVLGVSLEDLTRSWSFFFQEGRRVKSGQFLLMVF